MNIGDLVKRKATEGASFRAGLIVDLIEKKCWRTNELGRKVDWNKVDPEPHAVVMIDGRRLTIPITDLEIVNNKE